MIASLDTLPAVIEELRNSGDSFSLDTETTGLNPYGGDRLFSLIISTYDCDYYFNFNKNNDHNGDANPHCLPIEKLQEIIGAIDLHHNSIFMHNAKFDMHFLNVENVQIKNASIICTQATSRLVNNQLNSYSLAALGELIGTKKDDTVEKYISKHKLYTLVEVGKKSPRKDKHYDRVPFDIISKYGMQDGRVTYDLGLYILKRLTEINEKNISLGLPNIWPLFKNEVSLTRVLFKLEARGITIDKEFTKKAYEHYTDVCNEVEEKFNSLTGIEFSDSAKVLKKSFELMGLAYGTTEKGNASFSDANLPNNTLGDLVREYRHAYKLSNTYYKNFLDICDEKGAIHASFKQAGTSTGRMSCVNPNLQNVPKKGEENNPYPVRKCFIPRKGHFFVMIDFDQMEYRLLLDLSREDKVISSIVHEGLDVHTATAKSMGVDRTHAKTLNFMLLYGGGAAKLAGTLGVTLAKAKKMKSTYFTTLKKVTSLVRSLINRIDSRGYIANIYGRKLLKPVQGSYAIPNHYIQGSCGDIVKKAMVSLDEYLKDKKTEMLLQIHDEILFEVPYNEEYIIPKLVDIMQTSYTPRALQLTAGCDYSNNNWYDKKPYTGEEENV